MSEFSFDILHNLLGRLPAEDLFRCKAVCKLWKLVIDDPLFAKSHKENQLLHGSSILIRNKCGGRLFSLSLDCCLNYDEDGFKNKALIPMKKLIHRGVPQLGKLPALACNGLILITSKTMSWAIWNPLLPDNFHQVPPPPPPYSNSVKSGFGYDEASDDYKVVRVDYNRCLMYSLKLRCWRPIEGFPNPHKLYRVNGAYLNGSLHWITRKGVIALHLGREDHHLLPVPFQLQLWSCRLDALDGCLILSQREPWDIGVWVMKDYETDKTWTKLCSIACNMRVVAYLKSKGQVLLEEKNTNVLKWVDLENESFKVINIIVSGPNGRNCLSFGHISPGSLVRLDSTKSTRAGAKRKRESESRWKSHPYARFDKKKCPSIMHV